MKLITIVCLTAFSLAACDSKQEEARKAELDAKADKLDQAAKSTEKNAKTDADVVKKEGAAEAESLKNAADKTRDQK